MARTSDNFVNLTDLAEGLNVRLDPVKAPGLGLMTNAVITDRGGVATRPGTELLGAADASGLPTTGLHTMHKRDGTEILLKASGTVLKYYNESSSAFSLLKSGLTSGAEWGFADFNVNTDTYDYVFMGNGYQPYMRWNGAYGVLGAALGAGDTTLTVDSTLEDYVHETGTAASCTATSITLAAPIWATDIWKGFYVLITSGAQAGKIALISATAADSITFGTIAGLSGTPTFEIRRLKYAASGTLSVDDAGTLKTVTYSAVPSSTTFTITAGETAADGSAVAQTVEELPGDGCPRGNILTVLYDQMYVAGVQASPISVFRSKVGDATDFSYSSPRVAGEGDVVDFPDGGGRITDIRNFEDKLAIFKKSNIFSLAFSQDVNDLAEKYPIVSSPLIGTDGRTGVMGDEITFVSASGEVTTLSRVKLRDTRPLRTNIAWPIKYGIRDFDWSAARIKTFRNYTFIAGKATAQSATNDKVLVYDNNLERWIGVWELPVADFTIYNNQLYAGSSATGEVFRLLMTDTQTVRGTDTIGYETSCETNWRNLTGDGMSNQKFNTIALTGYVKLNTPVTFKIYYDFSPVPDKTWIFDPASANLTDNLLEPDLSNSLGDDPTGIEPLGMQLGLTQGDHGERRFVIYYTIPPIEHVWVKLGWETAVTNGYFELTDVKVNMMEAPSQASQRLIKSIETT